MSALALIGALLVIAGIICMAGSAIYRGRMSDARPTENDTANLTLEPRHRGMGFLSVRRNRLGLALAVIGAALLLFPLLLDAPPPAPD